MNNDKLCKDCVYCWDMDTTNSSKWRCGFHFIRQRLSSLVDIFSNVDGSKLSNIEKARYYCKGHHWTSPNVLKTYKDVG